MFESIKQFIKLRRSFIIYCLVGVTNTIVDFLVFTALTELGVKSTALCQAGGYCAGVLCSFLLNRNVTFKKSEKSGSLAFELISFIVLNAVSLFVGMLLIKLLVGLSLSKYMAKIAVTVITALINYFGYKILVFGSRFKK